MSRTGSRFPIRAGCAPIIDRASAIDTSESTSTILTPQPADLLKDCSSVAADVEADRNAARMDPVDELLLEGQDELSIDARANQRCRRISNGDQVRSSVDLGSREPKFHLDRKLEEIPHEGGIVVEVEHQLIDAPEIRALGGGPLRPAFDERSPCTRSLYRAIALTMLCMRPPPSGSGIGR